MYYFLLISTLDRRDTESERFAWLILNYIVFKIGLSRPVRLVTGHSPDSASKINLITLQMRSALVESVGQANPIELIEKLTNLKFYLKKKEQKPIILYLPHASSYFTSHLTI